mmetsp:Transcript_12319/g.31549  ORF Transcript_12319/g.31549 Transcript_12319/m.31549 type:complete len:243 (-) Transcript_12319:675-1403(-)
MPAGATLLPPACSIAVLAGRCCHRPVKHSPGLAAAPREHSSASRRGSRAPPIPAPPPCRLPHRSAAVTMAAYQSVTADSDLVFFRPAAAEDMGRITELEIAGYPPDEAATREKMEYRLEKAGNLFMVAVSGATDAIIGYVCATATAKEQLEEESMSVHDPDGTTACIHSVCVATEQRRKGVATRMLKSYIQWVQQTSRDITNMQLICKEHTIALYAGVGFQMIGPSKVVHGTDPWFDMKLQL